tara:strand:+ start:392 stop:532 length:141 start_codon:yes stop_codon:yes gene_type:complete
MSFFSKGGFNLKGALYVGRRFLDRFTVDRTTETVDSAIITSDKTRI